MRRRTDGESIQRLREFLETLEREGQLVRVTETVNPEPDIAAAGRAAANIKNGPAVLFEKIRGYRNRVVTNVHGSWQNHALMMGLDKQTSVKEQFFELNRRWDKYPVAPHIVAREDAPCKENVISEDINLFEFCAVQNQDRTRAFFIQKRRRHRVSRIPVRLNRLNVGSVPVPGQGQGQGRHPGASFTRHCHPVEKGKPDRASHCDCIGTAPIVTFMDSTPVPL
jgi:hypothetical protein